MPFAFKAFFFFSLIALSACAPVAQKQDNNKNIARLIEKEDSEDRDRGEDKDFEDSCRKRDSYSEEVSIEDLEFVDSGNAGEYELQGRCKERNALVFVTVNGYEVDRNPKCSKGRWEVTLDLTSVAASANSVVFQLSHNGGKLCKEVRVAFLGPKNYVPIPAVDDYYEESGFYVMKYEAKLSGQGPSALAVSQAQDKPLTRISHKEARTLCQNNGSRYDLIQNSQWQNIAISIEDVDENWSEGIASPSDDNALNCGISRGSPQEASTNDLNDCGAFDCSSGWDVRRRAHLLPGGERIWDICGNVGEIMKDKYKHNKTFNDYVYKLSSDLKALFGPVKTYKIAGSSSRRSSAWNLGHAKIQRAKDLIIRGAPGRDAGIFSVDITENQTKRGSAGDVGFRCVYIP